MKMEWINRMSSREKGMLALALLFLALLVIYFSAVMPTWSYISKEMEDIEMKEGLCRLNRGKLKDELLVREEYRALCSLIPRTSSSTVAIERMKEEIGRMASASGVLVDSLNHRDPEKTEFCEKYLVEISKFQADMTELLNFLGELNRADGMLRISKLSIKPGGRGGEVEGSMLISRAAMSASDKVEPPANETS